MGSLVIYLGQNLRLAVLCVGALVMLPGCFSERSYPLSLPVGTRLAPPPAARASAREWLAYAHGEMKDLLPARAKPALLTNDLTDAEGQAVRVFDHFKLRFDDMDTLLGNFGGLLHTVQLVSATSNTGSLPPWPEFEDVWVPIGAELELAGRLGLARDESGALRQADCLVILPGLYGDNAALRTRDLAGALRDNGFHVLALELRGCGQTERRYPQVSSAWGILDTGDLLRVSEWLEERPEVQRTGLIGFCWGGSIAMMTAWEDNRPDDDPSVSVELAPYLRRAKNQRHYTAGVQAFSPVLRVEELIDELDHQYAMLSEPVLNSFQNTLRERQRAKGHEPANGSLRDLINQEIKWGDLPAVEQAAMGMDYLRMLPYKSKSAGHKLDRVQTPLLIVTAANDPLIPAQDLADLLATVDNPNVAALILPGGGHIGFAAYSKAYYFKLIHDFFAPHSGPLAVELD